MRVTATVRTEAEQGANILLRRLGSTCAAGLFAANVVFMHNGLGTGLGFFWKHAPIFIDLFGVLGLAFPLVGALRIIFLKYGNG